MVRANIRVSNMLSYINSRLRMRKENLLPTYSELFEHKLPLTANTLTEDLPQRPKQEVVDWLNEICEGKFQYIFDMGDLWGISFEREEDAIQFKLTWG